MTTEIRMPALAPGMENGRLARWLVREGDAVRAGDVLAEIETGHAVMDVEAAADGRLGRILVPAGTVGIRVDTPIAELHAEVRPDASAGSVPPGPDEPPATGGPASQRPPAPRAAAPDAPEAAPARAAPPGTARPAVPTAAGPAVATPATTPPRSPQAAVPPPGASVSQPEPDWPDGTPTRRRTVREALRDALADEMRRDDAVFLMGLEVGEYQGAFRISQGLLDEFGARRVVDTPVAEQGFAGLAIGAAFAGLKPVVEFMSFAFALQAMDQIVNSAAKSRYRTGGALACPIVFRGPAGPAPRVGAQHAQDVAAWFAHVPGLKLVAPYAASDAGGLLRAAIRDPDPVIFLENEALYGLDHDVPLIDDPVVPIGRARLWRTGRDVTLVSFGLGMIHTLAAADILADEGIEAEVVDLRSLRPMDTATILQSVRKTNRCVTVEEGWPIGSIGAGISAMLMQEAFDWLDAPVACVTGADVPMPYAEGLEALARPDAGRVAAAARAVCYR